MQGLQLRAEEKCGASPAVVEGLLAGTVARQIKCSLLPIPDGERKHAVELLEGGFHTPVSNGRQHYLGVRVPAEGLSERIQFLSQGLEIVDFAVEGDHVAAAGRMHRLMSRRR